MSIQPPNGILDITGATLRVSKMEFSNVTGFDTVLNNVARNTVLHVDTTEYTANVAYAVKPPNMFMAQFDLELAAGGTGLPCNFNYYNDSNLGTSFNGYNLSFNDTSIILTYDGGSALHTATLSSSLNNGVYRKVKVLFDRDTTLVSINGENVFRFKDELRPRTYDTGTTGYIRWWHNSPVARKIKNLKVSNGEKWAQEYDSAGLSSNISYTHGLVGVGTSVPEYTLDVAGDIRASGNLIVNGSNTLINTTSLAIEDGVIECGKGNSSAAKDLGFLMVRNDGSSTTNSNVAMFWDESTDALTFGFSDSGPTATTLTPNTTKTLNSYFVGNVGIGTVSPEQKLHIEDSANPGILIENTDGTLSLNQDIGSVIFKQNDNSSTGTGIIGKIRMSSVPANDGGNFYGEAANMIFSVGKFADDNANIDAVTIKNDGNVGIGTASPRWGFEVTPTGGLGGVLSCSNDPIFSHNLYYSGGWKYGTASTGGAYMRMIDSQVQFWNAPNSGSGTWDTAGGAATTTQRMTINEAGNVGIGTATPYAKLQVDIADASAASATWDATKVVFGDITNGNSQGLGFGVSTNSHASIISLAPGVAWRGLGYYSAWHKWYINNVEKMVLDSSGKLGIGTASPGSLLTFYKDYTVPANGSEPADDTTQGITFRSDLNSFGASTSPAWSNSADAVDTAKIWFQPKSYQGISGSAGVHGYLAFGTGYFGSQSNTPDMVINTGGNVGIGLASPAFPLDVDGVSRSRGVVVNSSFNNNTARPALTSGTTHPSYEIRSLGGNGNVGSTGADDGFLRLRAGGGTSTANASYIDLSGYSVYSGSDMRRNIVFGTLGTERMRIKENGNVGIGTVSPTRKFELGMNSGHLAGYLDTYHQSGVVAGMLLGVKQHGGTNKDTLYISDSGLVGIGTNRPLCPLDVPSNASGTISVNSNQGGYWMSWNTPGQQYYSNQTASVSGNFDGGSVTAHTFYAGYSIQFLSDRRIKKDIREIDDESALEKFRLLKPSKYKYIEPLLSGRTDKEVYGFIAQEVAEVLPEGVTIGGAVKDGTNQGHIPNIMSMCSIESRNISSDAYKNLGTEQKGEYIETGNTYTRHVVTITKTIDPSTFNVDDSTRSYKFVEQTKTTGAFDKNSDGKYHPLVFYSKDLKTIRADVVRVIDDSSFVVDNKLFDLNDELLLYGQRPDDFYRLNKDVIFTLASAALQEVDRQLQAEKSKTATLETQVAALLARVTALENA